MKSRSRRPRTFILTPEEKRIIACVLAALVLGLATKYYRAAHPRPPVPPTAQDQRAARLAQRTAAAQARSVRTAEITARPSPSPSEGTDDEE